MSVSRVPSIRELIVTVVGCIVCEGIAVTGGAPQSGTVNVTIRPQAYHMT